MPDTISLEETNKIRIAAGMAPLVEGGGGDDGEPDQDEVAAQNYAAEQARLQAERSSAATAARIAKLANQQQLKAKRAGKTLGEPDQAGDSAKSWAKSFKKGAKARADEMLAAQRKAEQDEADALAAATYDERDLRGLRVGHDVDAFEEGEHHVLTLKDGRIEDGEGARDCFTPRPPHADLAAQTTSSSTSTSPSTSARKSVSTSRSAARRPTNTPDSTTTSSPPMASPRAFSPSTTRSSTARPPVASSSATTRSSRPRRCPLPLARPPIRARSRSTRPCSRSTTSVRRLPPYAYFTYSPLGQKTSRSATTCKKATSASRSQR